MIERRLLLPDHDVPSRAAVADDDADASPDDEKADESAKRRIQQFILAIAPNLSIGLWQAASERLCAQAESSGALGPLDTLAAEPKDRWFTMSPRGLSNSGQSEIFAHEPTH
jgi:hypothetical protein